MCCWEPGYTTCKANEAPRQTPCSWQNCVLFYHGPCIIAVPSIKGSGTTKICKDTEGRTVLTPAEFQGKLDMTCKPPLGIGQCKVFSTMAPSSLFKYSTSRSKLPYIQLSLTVVFKLGIVFWNACTELLQQSRRLFLTKDLCSALCWSNMHCQSFGIS